MEEATFIRETIHFIHHRLRKNLQQEADKYGITAPQMQVLNEVMKHPKIGVKRLAEHLHMTHSTVSEIVDRLIKKGVLQKIKNERDKRSVDISLAEHVVGYLNQNQTTALNGYLAEVLDQLSEEEQQTVQEGLQLLLQAIEKQDQQNEKEEN